jgi:hypothetical protein
MKPNFALNLTHERIELLHRNGRRWIEVGVASLDSPDLGEELATLRRTALGLSPSGFATKLILPESQILYDEVEAPGPGRAVQEGQIRAALAGRTPYEVDELVFDWSGDGPLVKVAVVARETLDEAEQFAVQYKFNPVSFEARPDKAKFAGEPFFGPAAHAEVSLTAGETVEREAEETTAPVETPVAETPVVEAPVAEVAAVEAPVAEDAPLQTETTDEDLAAATMEAAPPSDDIVEAAADILGATAEDTAPLPDAPIAASVDLELPLAETVEPDAAPPVESPAEPAPVVEEAVEEAAAPVASIPVAEDIAPAPTEAEEAPVALDVTDDEDEDQGTLTLTTPMKPEPMAAPVETPVVVPAFSSRRTMAESGAAPSAPAPAPQTKVAAPASGKPPALGGQRGSPGAAANAALGGNARVTAPGIPGLTPERRAKVVSSGPIADPRATAKGAAAVKRSGFEGGLAGRPNAQRGKPRYLGLILTGALLLLLAVVAALSSFYLASGEEPQGDTAVVSAPETVTAPEAVETASAEEPAPEAVAEPAEAETAALADTIQPEPRPEAIAEATVETTDEATGEATVETTDEAAAEAATAQALDEALSLSSAAGAAAETETAAPATAETAEIDPEALADGQPEAALETPTETAEAETPAETATDALAEAPTETAPEPATTETAATDTTATTEIAPEAAPETAEATASDSAAPVRLADGQDEIFLATADAPPAGQPAQGLPGVDTATDGAPLSPMAPPPFGTVYQLGADGRIQPTAEGIVTPDGVTLIAGKPIKLPPPRPAAISDAPAESTAGTEATAAAGLVTPPAATDPATTEIAASDVFQADPALAGVKPRTRPEGLAPAAATTPPETTETPADDDAALQLPAPDIRLAGSRPRARPQEAFEIAAAARQETQAASLVADGPISPLAVALSPRPAQKPDNFSKAVEAAVAAAVQEQPVQVAAAEPPPQQQAEAAGLRVRKPTVDEGPERVEPEADDEPEAAPERRSAQLTGTVEKKATFSNAYNLSKIGLIGVYGTASDRHALIRQSNGRFKKVQVGDRVEGGTVASITADELRYQKGGRMYALKMPQG